MSFTLPAEVNAVIAAFAFLFSQPVWKHAQALLCGALLAPKASTLTAALRVIGLGNEAHFCNYHRVLNRASWNARKAAGVLLRLLVDAFASTGGALIFGLDETIERRWGRMITARAIYRDPVRSSSECFQKTSGLRWMSVHLLAFVPWANRVWSLPFLTALCPSERYAPFKERGRRHKPVIRRARGLIGQVCRWLPQRPIIFVADGTYAALELLYWCVRVSARRVACCSTAAVTVITRLRLNAALYHPAPKRVRKKKGRARRKGNRQPSLQQRLKSKHTKWLKVTLPWYGAVGAECLIEYATGTAVWYHAGKPVVPIRWVLVRDPSGKRAPMALLSTNQQLCAEEILRAYVRRWQMEVTFEETRAHLGIEGQRQWSDKAIERSTPIRLALFSLITLIAKELSQPAARQSAWYTKPHPTFTDSLAAVRRALWRQMHYSMSASRADVQKNKPDPLSSLIEVLCFAG